MAHENRVRGTRSARVHRPTAGILIGPPLATPAPGAPATESLSAAATSVLDNGRSGRSAVPSLAAMADLVQRHGAGEAQRLLGPARFVEALVRLRQAGFDV